MSDVITNVLNVSAVTTSGNSGLVDTYPDVRGGPILPRYNLIDTARFYLNVATLTGTAPTADITIVATLNGIEHIIGTFTQATGTTKEFIDVILCPGVITAKYTLGGTVTDFTATIDTIRIHTK